MGEVYRGLNLADGEPVAIKVLRRDLRGAGSDALARFLREGEALRDLNHPNIVKMLDFVENDGLHYLVMEYVPGGSLEDLLGREGRLPGARVLNLALDLADALTHAHRLEIIHRDLKPANVLLAADGTARLTDFGIARLMPSEDRLTGTGLVLGTPKYMSPEAFAGSHVDARSDIWSLGVLLFEMLAGRPPFAAASLPALMAAILGDPTPDLEALCPGMSEDLADLVSRMLEKSPRERLQTMRLVGAELEALLVEKMTGSLDAAGTSAPEITTTGTTTKTRRFVLPSGRDQAVLGDIGAGQPAPLVGREDEMRSLAQLFRDGVVRLVTLVGPGGIGKTRLGLALAEAEALRGGGGVCFVDLTTVEPGASLAAALCNALAIPLAGGSDPEQDLLAFLRHRDLLLVLDNFEHLVGQAASVAEILRGSPKLRMLVTSRSRLNISAERVFLLGGMAVPATDTLGADEIAGWSAIELFLDRARHSRPSFELAPGDVGPVIQICRLLDGLPLGIVLAAAWVELLSPSQILAELETGFDFLDTETVDVPDRHRGLQAVFESSWALLGERERELWRKLSVFRGGFDRDAARAVAGAGPRELRSLQHRSLIERSQEGRFWSHELLRHFAEKKLVGEEAEKTRADHCAFYARSMDVWTDRIHGPEQMIALSGLRHEKLNLYAAWEWALERARVTELTRLLPGVLSTAGWISWERGSRRFFGAVEGALDRGIEKLSSIASPAARRLVARLLASQAFACFYRGDGKRASQRLASAKAALAEADVEGEDCRRERIRLLEVGAAILELGTGRTDAAATQLEEALELARGLGDRWQEASLLSALSRWALGPGIHLAPVDKRDRELALRRSEDALALFRELGAPHDIAEALMDIARLARLDDDLTTARARMEEARAIFTQADDRAGVAHAAGSLGRVLAMEGKLEEARSLLEESVALYAQEGAKPLAVFFRQRLAGVCARLGRYDEAEAHINEVLSFLADVEFYAEPEETRHAQVMKAAIALARGEPAEARRFLDNALSRPSRSPDPDELLLCAAVARKSGNGDEAARSLARAYARALEGGAPPFLFLVEFVAEAAFQLCERGETEQAVELYALATRDTPETPQLRDFGGLRIHDAAVRLGDHVAAAARDRGAAKDLPTAAREILHEIESRSATGRY